MTFFKEFFYNYRIMTDYFATARPWIQITSSSLGEWINFNPFSTFFLLLLLLYLICPSLCGRHLVYIDLNVSRRNFFSTPPCVSSFRLYLYKRLLFFYYLFFLFSSFPYPTSLCLFKHNRYKKEFRKKKTNTYTKLVHRRPWTAADLAAITLCK